MEKEVLKVRIIDEPQTKFYLEADAKTVEIRNRFTCPHCDEESPVVKKIFLNVFDVENQKFVTLELPEVRAKEALTQAYNTLLQRITRAINARGFWAKVKALFKKEVITFPNPSNTFWTIEYDKDSDYKNMKVTAEVKENT